MTGRVLKPCSSGLAVAFGGCNYQVGYGAKSVKRRAAVLMQACINTSMLALCRSLNGMGCACVGTAPPHEVESLNC